MKKFLTMMAIAVLSMSLAACGGGGGGGDEPEDVGHVKHGGTPADTMFVESERLCEKHGGYYEKTTVDGAHTDTVVYYEIKCRDGAKIKAGFNSEGRTV